MTTISLLNPSHAPAQPLPKEQPLWLNAEEAELLLSLCLSSTGDVDETERRLLGKLGEYLRGFSG